MYIEKVFRLTKQSMHMENNALDYLYYVIINGLLIKSSSFKCNCYCQLFLYIIDN